jgi:protein involved in polysaccharide export with SLBB domain
MSLAKRARRLGKVAAIFGSASMILTVGMASPSLAADPAPAAAAPARADSGYHLAAGDKIRVTTFDEPSLTGEFTIDSTGKVDLPLIGSTSILGMTGGEAQSFITTKLKQGYLKNPQVSIEILSYRPFFILGEVNKPGSYPYTDDLTVMNAIATAGGFTYRAQQKRVYIKHPDQSTEQVLQLTPQAMVKPGDTIRVGERYF